MTKEELDTLGDAGGTATRSTPGNPSYIQYSDPWVLVEII